MKYGGKTLNKLFCLGIVLCLGLFVSAVARGDDMSPADHAKSLSAAFRNAAQVVKPAVVTIHASYKLPSETEADAADQQGRQGNVPFSPFPREEGESDDLGRPTSVGSGLIVDPDGIILTNNHVVNHAHQVVVRLADGTELKAIDIRTDPDSDLAVLRVKSDEKLPYAKLGDSKSLDIGDWVIAIGTPFELEATVSAGIVSAKERSLKEMIPRSRLIQTDAAINPGNSGGPLVNLNGEVVGINTAIATQSGSFQGVGFAVPANLAKWVMKELLEQGKVRRAWLGISIGDLEAAAARKMKLATRSGVLVTYVAPAAPAGKAGVKPDDVILEFGGIRVRSPGDLQETVEQLPIGSQQKMQLIRGGEKIALDVTIEAFPENPSRLFPGRDRGEEKSPGTDKGKSDKGKSDEEKKKKR